MSDKVKVNISQIERIIVGIAVIGALSLFVIFPTAYTPTLVFVLLLLIWTAHYTFESRESMSEMCCMMGGMFFGMIAGFFVGALIGLATADFLVGMIAGTIAGFLFGIPVGRFGGHLGRMEGVMAAPMGGIMGGMTGVMIQYFNVALFMPFFTLVTVFTIWEMVNLVKGSSGKISTQFLVVGIVLSLLSLGTAAVGDYSIGQQQQQQQQQLIPTAPEGEVQEIAITVNPINYEPNYIEVKKDIPVKLTLTADKKAGCTRSLIIPAFGVNAYVPAGQTKTVTFTPNKEGTFPFSCSMNMAKGTIVVK